MLRLVFGKNVRSMVVLGLVLGLTSACSGGKFLGQDAEKSKTGKGESKPIVSDDNAITDVEEIMDLPVQDYYVQTFVNIAGTVGDDEFYVEGMAFSDIASQYYALVEDQINDGDTTLTIGEKLAEAGVDAADSTRDEFIEALDVFQNLSEQNEAAALKLHSAFALQQQIPVAYASCSAGGSYSTTATGTSTTCQGVSTFPVPVASFQTQYVQTAANIASNVTTKSAVQPTPTAQPSCGGPTKGNFKTMERNAQGVCVSKVSLTFDKWAADSSIGIAGACQRTAGTARAFLNHAAGCSVGMDKCDPTLDGSGNKRDLPNGFTKGTNAEEYAIAQYGLEASFAILNSDQCKGKYSF